MIPKSSSSATSRTSAPVSSTTSSSEYIAPRSSATCPPAAGRPAPRRAPPAWDRRHRWAQVDLRRARPRARSPREVRQLVLADLQLVALFELVRLDPAAVHVRAVERAGVVE